MITDPFATLTGAAAGLALYWSVSPQVKNYKTFISMIIGFFLSAAGARLTISILSTWFPGILPSSESYFFAAAFNGVIILPFATYINKRAEKGS